MYAKRENNEEKTSAVTGRPLRSVFLNTEGAFPEIARPSMSHIRYMASSTTADVLTL
jgi:hypothetical protein